MIVLDMFDKRPIYEQVVSAYQKQIAMGILVTDEKLPSVRQLAMEMSINPNTIQKAYAELERSGYIYSVKGKGNFVADISTMAPERQREFFMELDELLSQSQDVSLSDDSVIAHVNEFYAGRNNK